MGAAHRRHILIPERAVSGPSPLARFLGLLPDRFYLSRDRFCFRGRQEESPQKRSGGWKTLRNGLAEAGRRSETVPERLENVQNGLADARKSSLGNSPVEARKRSEMVWEGRENMGRDNSLATRLATPQGCGRQAPAQQSLPWSRWRSTRPLTYRMRGVVGGFRFKTL